MTWNVDHHAKTCQSLNISGTHFCFPIHSTVYNFLIFNFLKYYQLSPTSGLWWHLCFHSVHTNHTNIYSHMYPGFVSFTVVCKGYICTLPLFAFLKCFFDRLWSLTFLFCFVSGCATHHQQPGGQKYKGATENCPHKTAALVMLLALVQDCSNSIANALALLQTCTMPSM